MVLCAHIVSDGYQLATSKEFEAVTTYQGESLVQFTFKVPAVPIVRLWILLELPSLLFGI
jgi:hypothetical protein